MDADAQALAEALLCDYRVVWVSTKFRARIYHNPNFVPVEQYGAHMLKLDGEVGCTPGVRYVCREKIYGGGYDG